MKRWNQGFTRRNPQNLQLLETGNGYVSKTVTSNDNKFVWGIPGYEITLNQNVVQNPGW
ncbi:hypothetical protein ACYX7F_06130 [Sphingobacterium hungaricum]